MFPNEQVWIHWALFFFRADRAAHFLDKVLQTEAKGKGPYLCNWTTFSEMFMELFFPKNEQLTALMRLEGMSWYQAKGLVRDYVDCFQELTEVVEYDDHKTIVIKFYKGLDPMIQNKVVLSGDHTPDFDNLEGWYEAAWKVAWNQEANEAFVKSSRGTTQSSRPLILTLKAVPSLMYTFGVPQRISFQPTPTCILGAAPLSSKDGPELMDVDQTHGWSNFLIICWHCNKPGHYAREYPNAFDVQMMMMQEKLSSSQNS